MHLNTQGETSRDKTPSSMLHFYPRMSIVACSVTTALGSNENFKKLALPRYGHKLKLQMLGKEKLKNPKDPTGVLRIYDRYLSVGGQSKVRNSCRIKKRLSPGIWPLHKTISVSAFVAWAGSNIRGCLKISMCAMTTQRQHSVHRHLPNCTPHLHRSCWSAHL
jgi:hypothetical protein